MPACALLIAAAVGVCFAARAEQNGGLGQPPPISPDVSAPLPSALDDASEGMDELEDDGAIEAAIDEDSTDRKSVV